MKKIILATTLAMSLLTINSSWAQAKIDPRLHQGAVHTSDLPNNDDLVDGASSHKSIFLNYKSRPTDSGIRKKGLKLVKEIKLVEDNGYILFENGTASFFDDKSKIYAFVQSLTDKGYSVEETVAAYNFVADAVVKSTKSGVNIFAADGTIKKESIPLINSSLQEELSDNKDILEDMLQFDESFINEYVNTANFEVIQFNAADTMSGIQQQIQEALEMMSASGCSTRTTTEGVFFVEITVTTTCNENGEWKETTTTTTNTATGTTETSTTSGDIYYHKETTVWDWLVELATGNESYDKEHSDSDGDGYSDAEEEAAGTDPMNAGSHPSITYDSERRHIIILEDILAGITFNKSEFYLNINVDMSFFTTQMKALESKQGLTLKETELLKMWQSYKSGQLNQNDLQTELGKFIVASQAQGSKLKQVHLKLVL